MRRDPARLILPSGLLGAGALLVTLAGFAIDRAAAVHGWLFATLFFLGLSLGATALRAIHGLTGGTWGTALAIPLRAIAAMLPVASLGFIPLLFALDAIFPWRDLPASDPVVTAKLAYMATPFVVARLAACLAAFAIAARLAGAWSGATPSPRRAVVALVLWAVGLLVFTTDWMVAPDPRFHSTIYPVLEAGAEMLGALALAIIAAVHLLPFRNVVTGEEDGTLLSEDLANLLFGFLLFFIYLAFMQWLVIWSGNLPDEIGWYLARSSGARLAFLLAATVLAAIVSAGLLRRASKRNPQAVAWLAVLILAAVVLESFWRIRGGFAGSFPAWPDVTAFLGFGALFAAFGLRALGSRFAPNSGFAHG